VPEIKWLPEAIADIERLHAFLHEKSPGAASRAAKAILEGANFLKSTPGAGRLMPDESGRKELILPFGSGAYVLRYMLEEDSVVIIRVWHSREHRG
jgi:plasmid stabilization system protein ParE